MAFKSSDEYMILPEQKNKFCVVLRTVLRGSAPSLRGREGLTLLELIIYIGIATIVLVVLSAMLISFVDSWGRSRARARVEENLRFAMQAIQESAASADEILEPASGGSDTLRLALPVAATNNQTLYGWAWSGNNDYADGTITGPCGGAWCTASPEPSLAYGFFSSVTANGYVYIIGGYGSDPGYQSSVYYAKLNTDGTITGPCGGA